MQDGPGQRLAEAPVEGRQRLLERPGRSNESPRHFGGHKFKFQGLAAQAQGHRDGGRIRGAMAHIDELVFDPGRQAEQQNPLEAPVRNVNQVLADRVPGRQDVAEVVARQQQRCDPAERAGEEPVGLFQVGRSPALRAGLLDLE